MREEERSAGGDGEKERETGGGNHEERQTAEKENEGVNRQREGKRRDCGDIRKKTHA